ncbi:MAG: 2-oxoacid:ferredoxin oxidoreductase subunit gamma [Spirochaetales bacterium]|nr:MAG: 2-oxoacid:ferredoxin oxidoreductase subunit gamma [Spirochaetales bacterium]
MIQRFVFSGTGGQGMITAALILAEAALFYQGLNAVQTQMYGPEARGGSARSDVIISDREILFPKVLEPNVLVCVSQMAYDRYSSLVRPGGVVITDPFYVKRWVHASSREFAVPLHDTVGPGQGFNISLLGAVVRLIPVVGLEAVRQAVAAHFPGDSGEQNLRALETGASLITESVRTF